MKRLKKKITEFILWNIKGKSLSKNQKRRFKFAFTAFFEGYDYEDIPVIDISINSFGITHIKLREFKKLFIVQITLQRPGLLIGAQGRTIDSITEYLTDRFNKNVNIKIKESKLWMN